MSYEPCRNPNCKSYGEPHPNCKCGTGQTEYALGGWVCSGVHKDNCEHYADGGAVEANQKLVSDPNHAIGGVALHHGLLGLLTKTGYSKSPDQNKPTEDYIDHSRKGHAKLEKHAKGLFNKSHPEIKNDKNDVEALKEHLTKVQENPESLLNIGGSIDLPGHAGALGALAGTAINHLNSVKPKPSQTNPLDQVSPVSNGAQASYDRHLSIAQNPSLIMQHVKDGTLLPQDLQTLQTLYPAVHKSMVDQAGEALIDAKTNNTEIPYAQKRSLSMLMGQPMASTMNQSSMQAIIQSNGVPQVPQKPSPGKPKKASGVELKQINKVNSLYQTPLEARQADKKD